MVTSVPAWDKIHFKTECMHRTVMDACVPTRLNACNTVHPVSVPAQDEPAAVQLQVLQCPLSILINIIIVKLNLSLNLLLAATVPALQRRSSSDCNLGQMLLS